MALRSGRTRYRSREVAATLHRTCGFAVVLLVSVAGCSDSSESEGAEVSRAVTTVQFSAAGPTLDYTDPALDSVPSSRADTLRMEERYGDRDEFGEILALQPVGDKLVVADRRMDPHLAVIDRSSRQLSYRFGPHGQGPGEFRSVTTIFRVPRDSSAVGAFDVRNQRMSLVALREDRGELLRDVPFRAGNLITRVLPHAGQYVAVGGFPTYRLTVFDTAGRRVRRIRTERPSAVTERVRKAYLARRMTNSVTAKEPGGSRVALAFLELNRIEIVDLDRETYRVIKGPRPTDPAFTTDNPRPLDVDAEEHERAYFGIAATEDRVYAAFCGCVHPQAATRKGQIPMPQQIQVFDWTGDYLGELTVDTDVRAIAVPPGDSILYGSIESPVPYVGEWRLPAWLRSDS